MLAMETNIDMGADLQRRIGLAEIRRQAAEIRLAMEPTPLYASVVAALGEPPLIGAR